LSKGKLYLIPTFLSNVSEEFILPDKTRKKIKEINIFIVENVRTARRHIKKIYPDKNINNTTFYTYGKNNHLNLENEFLPHILKGNDLALLSEAGAPCIADPGARIVEYAHNFQIDVIPLIGPSSIFLALMSSGMNGQSFSFTGYIPIEKKDRIKKIKDLESIAKRTNQTQIFMETPYRNQKLFDLLKKTCNQQSKLCIATNITGNDESIQTKTIQEWKYTKIDIHKKPTIFLLSSSKLKRK